jgi:TolB-like protein
VRQVSVSAARFRSRPYRLGASHTRRTIGTVAAAFLVIACIATWFWPPAISPFGEGNPAAQTTAASITPPLVAPRLSIVVLPFANLSKDPDQQYFVDGITEDLTTDLSSIADTFVISRNTAFRYRNKPIDAKHIGRELDVRYVLEGSVQRSGNQVRVNAQLIDAETDAHLWAERFDRDTGNLLALQDEVTNRIAVALNVELTDVEAARPNDHPMRWTTSLADAPQSRRGRPARIVLRPSACSRAHWRSTLGRARRRAGWLPCSFPA